MRQRGCCDGIFTVKLALQKRHEHGIGTWAVFIDLVKAFDSVPRDGLYITLGKLGFLGNSPQDDTAHHEISF